MNLLTLRTNREALRGARDAREQMFRDFRRVPCRVNLIGKWDYTPEERELLESRTLDAERSHYDYEPEDAA